MGDYASFALRGNFMHGSWRKIDDNYVPRKRPRCSCVICKKVVEATDGLDMHTKEKHSHKKRRVS